MRKFSLLVGTLGGAMAGYLFSNGKLREELANSKSAEDAGKVLAKHLQKDGKQLGSHVKKFVESDDVQKNLGKAKMLAKKHLTKVNEQMKSLVKMGSRKAGKTAAKASASVKKMVEKKVG